MIVTNRRLAILAGVAAAMLILTAVVMVIPSGGSSDFRTGQALISGFDPEAVATVTVVSGDVTTTLRREGDGFTVAERSGYPASVEWVNRLLLGMLDIRCASRVTTSSAAYAELGVADGAAETTITLADAEGGELVTLLVGDVASAGQDSASPMGAPPAGRYVRLAGGDAVYLTENPIAIPSDPASALDRSVVDLDDTSITEVTVDAGEESYSIKPGEDGDFELEQIPEGKRPKAWMVKSVATAFKGLRFEDIVDGDEVPDQWDVTYTCRAGEHLTYTAQLAKVDENRYMRVSATGPSAAAINSSQRISVNESAEQLSAKDEILQAADAAAAFNRRHKGWVYRIPSWKADSLCRGLDELLEDVPDLASPEKITASHILIGYEGADRSEATRTKQEARKLAADILAKAKAPGADFAALAKEFSEGPSKTRGGDLGEFGRNAMHKNFEQAAWKLAVGQISDLVETPFGFHVIKRTK